jgi:hypothetical protein
MERLLGGRGTTNGNDPILVKDRVPNSPAEPEVAHECHARDGSGPSRTRQQSQPAGWIFGESGYSRRLS